MKSALLVIVFCVALILLSFVVVSSAKDKQGFTSANSAAFAKEKGNKNKRILPRNFSKKRAHAYWKRVDKRASSFSKNKNASFAFVVNKRMYGFNKNKQYKSASVVKAMLLSCRLRQLRRDNISKEEKDALSRMIVFSDNDAASQTYQKIGGVQRLNKFAKQVQMTRFQASSSWGLSLITARDQARFFYRYRSFLPPRHRKFAMKLLKNITPSQSWGIKKEAPKKWQTFFKGGWYPDASGWRVHQSALLKKKKVKMSLSVLTANNSSYESGQDKVESIASKIIKQIRK